MYPRLLRKRKQRRWIHAWCIGIFAIVPLFLFPIYTTVAISKNFPNGYNPRRSWGFFFLAPLLLVHLEPCPNSHKTPSEQNITHRPKWFSFISWCWPHLAKSRFRQGFVYKPVFYLSFAHEGHRYRLAYFITTLCHQTPLFCVFVSSFALDLAQRISCGPE